MFDAIRGAGIVEGCGKLAREADTLIELADRKQPRVTGQRRVARLDDNGALEEIEAELRGRRIRTLGSRRGSL